ncbi:unnamed protein product [Brachionus calyciflorus]|uniref:RRM domain-containing protein n=1 Tax=Brachionus calyciflorus TaxID=104777 RepID=A0A813SN29_9BILA|nr:unnamed protein product [Brachionus calyciflorus]
MATLMTQNDENQQPKSPSSLKKLSPNPPEFEAKKEKQNGTSKFVIEIPRLSSSRDLRPQRSHSPCRELEQFSYLFMGPGAKRDANKSLLKIRSSDLEDAVKKAKKYAMEQSVRFALVKQQQQQQKQQMDLLKKQQALLLMCRIYIGSIFYEVKEEQVKIAFGAFGPIRSITMSWDAATNKHKGFAFIEFETPEAAQIAYEQMNGALLGGRNVKVGRPSNMPQAQPIIDQMTEDCKKHHRVYVASIHPELSEQDVQSVFEAFGTIKCCNLVRDIQTGKHKGYGFIEFETPQAAQDAIASMNLFDLGGNLLRVGKAITPPDVVSNQAANPLTGLPPTQAPTGTSVSAGLAAQLQDIGVFNSANSSSALLSSSSSASNLASQTKTSSSNLQNTVSTVATSVSTTTTTTPSQKQPSTEKTSQPSTPPVLENLKISTNTTKNVPSQASPGTPPVATPIVEAPLGNKELTENQKKLLSLMNANDDSTTTLEQQSELVVKGKEQRMLLMQKLMRRRADTRVIVLRNMVGPEDVDEELEIEITEECEKFGEVERVVIYQEKQSEEEDAEIIVKIFVEFTNPRSTESAVTSLNGRYFAGRIVKAETYDQEAYDARDLSG